MLGTSLRKRHGRALIGGATFLLTAIAAAPAAAGDVNGSALFFGLGSWANIHGLSLGAGEGAVEPDPMKDKRMRLDGGGHLAGGGMQISLYGKHVRGGFAISVFGVEGTELRHDKLPYGFSVKPQTAWGAGVDLFVGYQFLRGPVRPYVDLVGSFNAMSVDLDLTHPTYGTLGRTQYNGWQFGFGPRAGLSIALGKHTFFDLSGTYSLVGMDRFRIMAGFGFRSK